MVRDITIGQYYPAKSVIHRLDPRVKIVCTLLFLISLFIQRSILGYVVATLFLGAVIYMSRVPFKFIVKGLKPIMILLLITVLFNLFLTRGGAELVHFWIFHITEKGLETSVYTAIRLIYLIMGSSIMTFTTTPNSLTDGIETVSYTHLVHQCGDACWRLRGGNCLRQLHLFCNVSGEKTLISV